jgi:hypothetical protein
MSAHTEEVPPQEENLRSIRQQTARLRPQATHLLRIVDPTCVPTRICCGQSESYHILL